MAKTQAELNQLKKEYKALNAKLKELTDDELKEVVAGVGIIVPKIESPIVPINGNDPIL